MVKPVLPLLSVAAADYVEYSGKTAYEWGDHGAKDIDTDATAPVGLSVSDCEARCDGDAACDCVAFRLSDGKCWKRAACVTAKFGTDDKYDTYVKTSSPTPTPPPPSPVPHGGYKEYTGKNCYIAKGGVELDVDGVSGLSTDACQARCDADAACTCVTFRPSDGTCWKRSACHSALFGDDGAYTVYVKTSLPPPPTPGSGCASEGWVSQYDGSNPLGIAPNSKRSDNYILIIGDWGKADGPGPCQNEVADLMKKYVKDQAAQGKKCLFIAAVGDNFYWTGQSGDWNTQWGDVYKTADESSELHGIPFLAVMGNHDYGITDGHATCPARGGFATVGQNTYGSAQFNKDKNPSRPDWTEKLYWLPDYNYHYEIPEVGLELIAVDQSASDIYGLGGGKSDAGRVWDSCGGKDQTEGFLQLLQRSGEDLLQCRAEKGTASTVVIIQHYPDQGKEVKSAFDDHVPLARKLKGVSSISAYGHAHQQQCDGRNGNGQCDRILTGGGGGCCDSDLAKNYAGFTAVHLNDDGSFTSDVESAAVRLPRGSCRWSYDEVATEV